MYYFLGYRPNYQCKPFANDTANRGLVNDTAYNGTAYDTAYNDSAIWYEYGQCAVKVYSNTSDGLVVTEEACHNGWTYDIPRDQSFVTEVSVFCLQF